MALVFFGVTAKIAAVLADVSTDSDYNPNMGSFTADVTFTPLIRAGDVVRVFDATPPTMYAPVPVTAFVDFSDGLLKLRSTADAGGTGTYAPLRLLGNSSSLDLEGPLYYAFTFSNIRIDNKPSTYTITGGAFQAPNHDTTIDLIDYMRSTGQTATGVNRIAPGDVRLNDANEVVFSFGGVDIPDPIPFEPVFATDNITDATTIGRAVMTAANTSAAQTAIDSPGLTATKNVFTGKAEYNGGFTNSYDTALWIAPAMRTNPTVHSQGMYIQHRVSGDLGGVVHDAGASELRLVNACTNTGSGQSAFEASLVVTGTGTSDVGTMTGLLSNFHTTDTPAGNIDRVDLISATQIPPLAGTLTIDEVVGLRVDQQLVGATNWTIYAPNGNSIFGPTKVSGDITLVSRSDSALGKLLDTNGNVYLLLGKGSNSAVNYLQINNAPTGSAPTIYASGSDADVDVQLYPKGAGNVRIVNGIRFALDTIVTRSGAGVLAVAGVDIPTISSTHTLSNKSIALGSNTVTGTTAQFNTALTDGDFATLAGTETLLNKSLTSPAITTPTGIVKADVGLGNVDNTSDANKPVSTAAQTALNLKEDTANRNANSGYCGLDSSGKVAAAQLPSYVDDVVEAANFAALPGTGETGKIYVTMDANKTYRWSGSAYVEISASPGSTDSVTEGSTNLYYTNTRADARITAWAAASPSTLTNKTLTAPKIDTINDTNGNVNVTFGAVPSAVNNIQFNNAVAGSSPTIYSVGADTDLDVIIYPKGAGNVRIVNGIRLSSSDTIITRSAAGILAVAGVVIPTVSSTHTLTNKTLTTPVLNGTPTGTGVASAATASTLVLRDSNANLTANNNITATASTVTAAGTTALTIASAGVQIFTGSTTQTVKLPTTSVTAGQQYTIVNQSSGAVTVQSSAAETVTTVAAGTGAIVLALAATPTTAAQWRAI